MAIPDTAITAKEPLAPPAGPLPGARAALALLLAINLFNYIDRQVLAAVEPSIREELLPDDPFAEAKTGALALAFLLTYSVIAPLFGWLGDRVPRWRLIGVGVLLWSAASGASGLAGAFTAHGLPAAWMIAGWTLTFPFIFLFVTRCLVGVGEGAYGPVAPTMIADLYPIEKRGSKLAWFYLAFPVGSCLGYALGGMTTAPGGLGWRWAFYLVVPPGLLLGALCFFLREPPRGLADAAKVRRPRLGDYRVLLRTPSYVLNTLGMTAMAFGLGGLAFWVPAYLKVREEAREMTWLPGADGGRLVDGTTIFGGLTMLAGLIATLAGGIVGDKLRPWLSGSYFVVSGIAMLIAFPFILLVVATPFPLAWVWLFVAALCLFFNTGPTNTALANVTHPAVRATGFALNILVIHLLGDAISPFVVGLVAGLTRTEAGPNFDTGFQLISASVLLGGLFWLWAACYLARDTELAPHRLPEE